MPTVVVMDVSLSMTRPVSIEGSEEYQRKHLAAHGLTMLFEHMATNYKLEFTALVVFSSLWELMVPFTRDYNTLQVQNDWVFGCVGPKFTERKKCYISLNVQNLELLSDKSIGVVSEYTYKTRIHIQYFLCLC